jgi:hypothetical protein
MTKTSIKLQGLLFIMVVIFSPAYNVTADPVNITSSPSPKGSGARAIGMGRSFLTVGNDATAASWNPGCLIQLIKAEFSIVSAMVMKNESNEIHGDGIHTHWDQHLNTNDLNYISLTFPCELFKKNMVFSLNYQHLYDFSRTWNMSINQSGQDLSMSRDAIHFQQSGKLSAIGFAWCIQVIPEFAVGVTLNFWKNKPDNQWQKFTKESGRIHDQETDTHYGYRYFSKDTYSFEGFNANIGVFWDISNQFQMGAVIKTPFTAAIEHDSEFHTEVIDLQTNTHYPAFFPSPTRHEQMKMPASYGIGVSYHPSQHWVFSVDIYHIEWQNFLYQDKDGLSYSASTGIERDLSSVKPATQFHLGMEYLFIQNPFVIPARCGFFYEPAPAENSPDEYYGFTFGTGLSFKAYHFDLAYEFRFGRNVGKDI